MATIFINACLESGVCICVCAYEHMDTCISPLPTDNIFFKNVLVFILKINHI